MRATTVRIRQRGMLTLPAKLRAKYQLDDGDSLTVLDLGSSIILAPKVPTVPKLAAEIERMRQNAGVTVEELLTTYRTRRAKLSTVRRRR